MGDYSTSKIYDQHAAEILSDLYGIQALASPVHGEIDFNFCIEIDGRAKYLLKISRAGVDKDYLDLQNQILLTLSQDPELNASQVVKDVNGQAISEFTDENEQIRYVRLLTWIEGRLWHTVNPQLDALRYELGYKSGLITKTLLDFDHPKAHRELDWDVAQSLWTKEHTDLFSGEEKRIIESFIGRFETVQKSYQGLRKSVVHNDVNEGNIVVSLDVLKPQVLSIFDFGDALHTQVINDVAIACSYAIKDFPDPLAAALPLLKGYHHAFALQEQELDYLYLLIAMRLIVSITKAAINRVAEPENEYLQVSKQTAIDLLLKWDAIDQEFATYRFRDACGFSAHPDQARFVEWAKQSKFSLSDLYPTVLRNQIHPLELNVASTWLGHVTDFNDLELFDFKIHKLQKQHPDKIIAGGYLEPRALYIAPEYDSVGNSGRRSRTVHLGVDYWLPAYTSVHAVLDGEVVAAVDNSGDKQYGGLLILKHTIEDQHGEFSFFSLYGHLTVSSATQHTIGDQIKQGECIARLGSYPENGNWSPHLHFQLMLSMLDYVNDFAGVAYPEEVGVWASICPDPNLLFKCDGLEPNQKTNQELLEFRQQHLGKGLSLSYKTPLNIVRGAAQYLIDDQGRKFLDTVNNVAHVGHEHPDVVKAGQQQMAVLNTNSRYLHPNINELASELLETLPDELCVVHFVNSGSEANELAIRMLKTATGRQDILVSEVGYHGNTNAAINISSYKFDGKGGSGAPQYTHVFPLPDAFRGKYRGDNSGFRYAYEVETCISHVHAEGRHVAGMIIEPIISCGGQIVPPEGFLQQAFTYVREAGGYCVADEVQVGCGRVGKHFWGFELHDVIPDIVTIGKPLGNGHPVAAVVCTREIADKFANGMEYFNTFGGNPVSCAIASEVLRVVKRENLQTHANTIGALLKQKLQILSKQFPIIGDVRGEGLFLGFELVDAALKPLPLQTDYLINRMKAHSILMSSDGPDHNVIKIKPPLVFSEKDVDELLDTLEKVFSEDVLQVY